MLLKKLRKFGAKIWNQTISFLGKNKQDMSTIEFGPLKIKRLSDDAVIPKRESALAAGYDLTRYIIWPRQYVTLILYSAHDHVIEAHGKALIKTDLAIAVPEGTYGRIGQSFSFIFHRSDL